jgi:hypothetical protein
MLQIMFFVSLEALEEEGCMSFGFMALGLAVQKFLSIE